MKLRAWTVMACVVVLVGIGSRSVEACDRATVATVRSVELSCLSGHALVPFSAAAVRPTAVSPLVVAPLAVVPVEIAPAVVVESRVQRAVTVRHVRAAAIRPLVVRPERLRSVTRVRTIVR
jgi:hypothetical protein